eukprot:4218756-Heterocapsa_arctica.AAC.1
MPCVPSCTTRHDSGPSRNTARAAMRSLLPHSAAAIARVVMWNIPESLWCSNSLRRTSALILADWWLSISSTGVSKGSSL